MAEKITDLAEIIKKSATATEKVSEEPGFKRKKDRQPLRAAAEAVLVDHVVSATKAGISARKVSESVAAGVAEAKASNK